ncbi:hypothetical protein D3C78_1185960 [compost metagenome]
MSWRTSICRQSGNSSTVRAGGPPSNRAGPYDGNESQLHPGRQLRRHPRRHADRRHTLARLGRRLPEDIRSLSRDLGGVGRRPQPRCAGQIQWRRCRQGAADPARPDQSRVGQSALRPRSRHADQAGHSGRPQDAGADRHRLRRTERRRRRPAPVAGYRRLRLSGDPHQALARRAPRERPDQRAGQTGQHLEQPQYLTRSGKPGGLQEHPGRPSPGGAHPGRPHREHRCRPHRCRPDDEK